MLKDFFHSRGWLGGNKVIVSFDGQWGSTGKGVLNSYLAEKLLSQSKHVNVITNAGPNSGHTFWYGGDKSPTVLKQLPTAGVVLRRMTNASNPPWHPVKQMSVFLSAGAVIDMELLEKEVAVNDMAGFVAVDPIAAVISPVDDKEVDAHQIASTGQGVGPAIVRKLLRFDSIEGRYYEHSIVRKYDLPARVRSGRYIPHRRNLDNSCVFIEVAQGWDLGIHSPFWPYVTSRECGVAQGLADARIPPAWLDKSIMSVRCHPIRVGSTDEGSSGGYHPDQSELDWDFIGVKPEYTTVTGRMRRVFTWSRLQFRGALVGNWPDAIFLNFCNYLSPAALNLHVSDVYSDYKYIMGKKPDFMLLGFGPKNDDVYLVPGEDWASEINKIYRSNKYADTPFGGPENG